MVETEIEFADYLNQAINENYLITGLITSQTQAKVKSQNLPFGLGKTTLMLELMYHMNGGNWDHVFNYLCGNPYNLASLLEPGRPRINCAGWDAVQMTAPAEQGVPRIIRRMASYLSDTRPEIACLLMTASNINAIAAPLRKLIIFEVIVTERGHYEIQKISYHKNFKSPLIDLAKLDYLQEGEFPELKKEVYERYEAWRVKSKLAIYPHIMTELHAYMQMQDLEKCDPMSDIATHIVKGGRGQYMIPVPTPIGEKLHRQAIKVSITQE